MEGECEQGRGVEGERIPPWGYDLSLQVQWHPPPPIVSEPLGSTERNSETTRRVHNPYLEETEAQRGDIACVRSHSQLATSLERKPCLLALRSPSQVTACYNPPRLCERGVGFLPLGRFGGVAYFPNSIKIICSLRASDHVISDFLEVCVGSRLASLEPI